MVAGIFEKSKRLRKVFFFVDIQRLPTFKQPRAAINRGNEGTAGTNTKLNFLEK
jgi:hypothetical protein